VPELWERTDGVVTIRPPQPGDSARLIAGRDAEFDRFLGPGSDVPDPIACITVDGVVVGWVDHDAERSWLLPGEVNVGYNVFASHRGHGIATRALQLLMHHLAITGQCRTATLLIHPDNVRSRALAERTRFERQADLDGNPYYKRTVLPLTYSDGDVTIRRRHRDDLEMDLSGRDEEHIRWLWQPSEGDRWNAMTPTERRAHALDWLAGVSDSFGTRPRWTFSVDITEATSVAGVDVNLASDHAPPGEADISYWVHPTFRRRGIAPVAVRPALEFLRDHTATRRVHIMVDPDNSPSLAVAASLGATVGAVTVDRHGRSLLRHSLEL
jgi:RimJ/RimL family protein N-acetyltransferase